MCRLTQFSARETRFAKHSVGPEALCEIEVLESLILLGCCLGSLCIVIQMYWALSNKLASAHNLMKIWLEKSCCWWWNFLLRTFALFAMLIKWALEWAGVICTGIIQVMIPVPLLRDYCLYLQIVVPYTATVHVECLLKHRHHTYYWHYWIYILILLG